MELNETNVNVGGLDYIVLHVSVSSCVLVPLFTCICVCKRTGTWVADPRV